MSIPYSMWPVTCAATAYAYVANAHNTKQHVPHASKQKKNLKGSHPDVEGHPVVFPFWCLTLHGFGHATREPVHIFSVALRI